MGVVTALALGMLGLNNAAVWGISAGVLNSVPYFGPFIVTCGIGVIAFMQFGTISSVASIAGIALLFWTWMWGVWGTLLAVPMMMVAKAICDHVEDFGPAADFLGE